MPTGRFAPSASKPLTAPSPAPSPPAPYFPSSPSSDEATDRDRATASGLAHPPRSHRPDGSGASPVAGRPINVGPSSSITVGTPLEQHIA
jgi:hypothetical protein